MQLLPCVEVNPPGPVRYTVIWLHGLGANGHDFEPVVPHLGLHQDWGVRFVFPHAPSMPVTVNGGFVMPAWYDIEALGGQGKDDEPGILNSVEQVHALMKREYENGLTSEQIILAGFSQGGAIALQVAARYSEPLAGFMGLSTYLVLADQLEQAASPHLPGMKVFMAHGEWDPMVPFAGGQQAAETLERMGADLTWNTYPMQHEVCMEEIQHIGAWMAAIVAP